MKKGSGKNTKSFEETVKEYSTPVYISPALLEVAKNDLLEHERKSDEDFLFKRKRETQI